MGKIALCIISKGTPEEAVQLERALTSVSKHVGGTFVTLTGEGNTEEAQKVCQKFKANISYYHPFITIDQGIRDAVQNILRYPPHIQVGDKIFLFDEARNFNFSQVPKEYSWLLWIDTDDVFLKPENIRPLLELGEKENIQAFLLDYLYNVELDAEGKIKNVIIKHLRERIIRNDGKLRWKGIIHEILVGDTPVEAKPSETCSVVHLSGPEKAKESSLRNIKSLEYAIYLSGGRDSREIYYLSKAFVDQVRPEYDQMAQNLMFTFLLGQNRSQWPEERAQAWVYISEIYRKYKDYDQAIKSCMNALIDDPENREIFLEIAISYTLNANWDRALIWLNLAKHIEPKVRLVSENPRASLSKGLEMETLCLLNLGRFQEATKTAEKLVRAFPDETRYLRILDVAKNFGKERKTTENILKSLDLSSLDSSR